MIADDVIKLMEMGEKYGVEILKFDTLEIKFKNNNTTDSICGSPYQESDKPNPDQEIESNEEETGNSATYEDKLLAAHALNTLALENPDQFEELIANDEEALKQLEAALSEED